MSPVFVVTGSENRGRRTPSQGDVTFEVRLPGQNWLLLPIGKTGREKTASDITYRQK